MNNIQPYNELKLDNPNINNNTYNYSVLNNLNSIFNRSIDFDTDYQHLYKKRPEINIEYEKFIYPSLYQDNKVSNDIYDYKVLNDIIKLFTSSSLISNYNNDYNNNDKLYIKNI
jgi:hypothetical protein